MTRRSRITVVNDWPEFLDLLRDILTPDYEVTTLRAGEATVDDVAATRPDLILVDIIESVPSAIVGWRVVEEGSDHPDLVSVPIIVTTADLHLIAELDEAIREAGALVLAKPFSVRDLEQTVAQGLERRAARRRRREGGP